VTSQHLAEECQKARHRNTGMSQHDSLGRQLLAQMERGEKEPAERGNQQQHETDKNTLRCRALQQDRDQQEKARRAESRMQQGQRPGGQLRAQNARSQNQTARARARSA
jgi:hypothetical protein